MQTSGWSVLQSKLQSSAWHCRSNNSCYCVETRHRFSLEYQLSGCNGPGHAS